MGIDPISIRHQYRGGGLGVGFPGCLQKVLIILVQRPRERDQLPVTNYQ